LKKCLRRFSIKGFQEVTLIDWDGKIASIIFCGGCNFRCGFCHARGLVLDEEGIEAVPFDSVESFLKEKKGWIDGVVITGGEPTLDEKELIGLIEAIRGLSLPVKLDTNGSRPNVLKDLIASNSVDFIAMDVKAPFNAQAYSMAVNAPVEIKDIIESRDIVLDSGIEHEFRTTVVPGIVDISAIAEIARSIAGARRYCLQQFVPRDTINPSFLDITPYPAEELNRMATVASEHLNDVVIRNN